MAHCEFVHCKVTSFTLVGTLNKYVLGRSLNFISLDICKFIKQVKLFIVKTFRFIDFLWTCQEKLFKNCVNV